MKRKFFALVFSLALAGAFAQGMRVSVLNPDSENLDGAESAWLAGAVRDRLESRLQDYAGRGFVLVDAGNESKIKELQRKSESASFSEDTALEIGRLTSARYAVFSMIRKAGSSYSLKCDFTDLVTGEKKTVLVSGKKSAEELYSAEGCAADEAALKICVNAGAVDDARRLAVTKEWERLRRQQDQSAKAAQKQLAKESEDAQRREEKERKKQQSRMETEARYEPFNQGIGNGSMSVLRAGINGTGFSSDGFTGFNIDLNIGITPWVFIGISGGMIERPESLEPVIKGDYMAQGTFNLGFNWRPLILYYPPNFYVMGGIGMTGGKTKGTWLTKKPTVFGDETPTVQPDGSEMYENNYATYCLGKLSAGLEIPLGESFAIYAQGNLHYIFDVKESRLFDVQVGISLF